jgi:hypothetical protein
MSCALIVRVWFGQGRAKMCAGGKGGMKREGTTMLRLSPNVNATIFEL